MSIYDNVFQALFAGCVEMLESVLSTRLLLHNTRAGAKASMEVAVLDGDGYKVEMP